MAHAVQNSVAISRLCRVAWTVLSQAVTPINGPFIIVGLLLFWLCIQTAQILTLIWIGVCTRAFIRHAAYACATCLPINGNMHHTHTNTQAQRCLLSLWVLLILAGGDVDFACNKLLRGDESAVLFLPKLIVCAYNLAECVCFWNSFFAQGDISLLTVCNSMKGETFV